ncbi:MAG TPA: hypothetical protein VLH39_06065, partial [Magnetospirillaceae bacterium]|nr:hypothetical protein [Magnetospirillaceae bacterium]
ARWSPDLGAFSRILEPSFMVGIRDLAPAIRDQESLLDLAHAGVEIKALGFLGLRAGVNKGGLSTGVGLDIGFLELDAAVFAENPGLRSGHDGRVGVALQAAIRL